MKLRVRSLETKETTKIEAPVPCSVRHLKFLIAAHISPTSPRPVTSIHLSLNRKDEIDAADGDERTTIESLGLISGDLVFYTTNPLAFSGEPAGREDFNFRDKGEAGQAAVSGEVEHGGSSKMLPLDSEMLDSPAASTVACAGGGPFLCFDPEKKEMEFSEKVESGPEVAGSVVDDMVSDEDLLFNFSSFSIPGFLKRVMEEEAGVADGDLGLLVIAVHAVFLEFGFVVRGQIGGSRLPEGWAIPKDGVILVLYTLPALETACGDAAVAPAISVKFTQVGKFVTVYGSVAGNLGVYRVSFSAPQFVSSLASPVDKMDRSDEERVFELWKMVKDGLSLPLLIDISEKYGLSSPPCFTRLPTDLKVKILELISGVDLARVSCVNMELRYLSSNDELWGKKFIEEFELSEVKGLFGKRWKDKFVICWERRKKKKEVARKIDDGSVMPRPYWRRPVWFGKPGFNIIGGDYDRFPSIGGIGNTVGLRRDIPRPLHRQNFSPNCNFHGF